MSTEKEPKQSESGSGLDAAAEGRTVESGVGVGELSAEEWARVTERAGKADQYQEAWMRVAADLENFKKRAARERVEASKFANEALLGRIIPVLDTFEMALAAAANTQATSVQSLVRHFLCMGFVADELSINDDISEVTSRTKLRKITLQCGH